MHFRLCFALLFLDEVEVKSSTRVEYEMVDYKMHSELKCGKKCNFGTTYCLSQRLKSMFFEKFSSVAVPKAFDEGLRSEQQFSKNINFKF